MPLKPTDTQAFIECLDAGTLEPRLATLLSDVALAVREYSDKKRKGKITLSLDITPYGNGAEVDVTGDLAMKRPTQRGYMSENLKFNSRFFVNPSGNMTDYPETQKDFFNKPHQAEKKQLTTQPTQPTNPEQ